MAARKDKLLNLKCCCPEQWGKFSPHKSHSSWLLSKLAPWNRQSSVMTKESCCTTMKYPVNAEQGIQIHCQEKFSLFLLDQKQSHHINQAVFLQAHRPSHCSNGRKTLHIQASEKSNSCYMCSKLTVLQYLWILTSLCHQGKKKSTIIPFYVSCNWIQPWL